MAVFFDQALMLFSACFSLGVALSKGHGKFFFRGNVTVEEGREFSLSSVCSAEGVLNPKP